MFCLCECFTAWFIGEISVIKIPVKPRTGVSINGLFCHKHLLPFFSIVWLMKMLSKLHAEVVRFLPVFSWPNRFRNSPNYYKMCLF